MRILATLITFAVLTLPILADEKMRPDIDQDIPLAEAIRRANEQFPDAQPLTEDEVIAAVQVIKLEHPDIKEDIYETYMRVARKRVLPKNIYFSLITSWSTQYGVFRVDWKDLTLRGRAATAEESEEILSKVPGNIKVSPKEFRVGGFNYRIRARFVSSQHPIVGRPQ